MIGYALLILALLLLVAWRIRYFIVHRYEVVYIDQSGSAMYLPGYQARLLSQARRTVIRDGEILGFSTKVFPLNSPGCNGGTALEPVIEHANGRTVLVLTDGELYAPTIPDNVTIQVIDPRS